MTTLQKWFNGLNIPLDTKKTLESFECCVDKSVFCFIQLPMLSKFLNVVNFMALF